MTIDRTPTTKSNVEINKDARERFARNLKRWRDVHDMTQQELADKTGLSKQYLSNVERCTNNISLDNMQLIADALDIQLYVLLLLNDGKF